MLQTTTSRILTAGLIAGVLFSSAAMADPGHRGFRHGGPHIGVYVGPGFYGPGWGPYYPRPYYVPPPYPYPYYPPVVVTPAPAAPPVYIEQAPQQSAAPQSADSGYWYYCAPSEGYYPYVKECPSGWQKVAPQPAQ